MTNCWRYCSLPDEVASFLLYVKALDYQEKPDYQRLRRMLSSGGGGAGRLDFSLPGGGAGEGTSHVQDAPTSSRDQVRTTVAEEKEEMEEDWRRRERKLRRKKRRSRRSRR